MSIKTPDRAASAPRKLRRDLQNKGVKSGYLLIIHAEGILQILCPLMELVEFFFKVTERDVVIYAEFDHIQTGIGMFFEK